MTTRSTAERLNVTSTAVCRLAQQGESIAKSKGIELTIE